MDNDSLENKNANGSPAQGIFSTPELTVDAEKIAQNVNETNEASRAKIASIFANTETGQQAQRLNDAMTVNSQPATEDIVINNGPKKRKKWPIILAIVVLISAIGGVVGWAVVKNLPRGENVTPATAFANYLEYLEKGPEEYRSDEQGDEWFLFEIGSFEMTSSERKDYFAEAQKKFAVFYEIVPDNDSTLKDLTVEYKKVQDTLFDAMQMSELSQAIDDIYLADGSKPTYDYINSNFPIQDGQILSLVDTIRQRIGAYLRARLSILEAYSTHNCIKEGAIDLECASEVAEAGTAINEAERIRSEDLQIVEYNTPKLENIVKTLTEDIAGMLEGGQNE